MEKKAKINTIVRMAVLLTSVLWALVAGAQTSLSDRLNYVLESHNKDMGKTLYYEIKESDLVNLPDSSLFDYHFLGAYINSEIPDHEKAIKHLLEAKRLCESSLGVYSTAYQEVMIGLGEEYEELGNYEEALSYFEEGLVKTTNIRNDFTNGFMDLLLGVQRCHENLGWFKEIPTLLLEAWAVSPKEVSPLTTSSYFPLWLLERYYEKYGFYDKALAVSDDILKFIKSNGGTFHPELSEEMYRGGNILTQMGKFNIAIEVYRQGMAILKHNNMETSETYKSLSGNLLGALFSAEEYNECDKHLKEIKQYSKKTNNPEFYKKATFHAAKQYADKLNFPGALSLISELLDGQITNDERKVIEQQRRSILFNQGIIDSLNILKSSFESLPAGTVDWFDTAHKLSCAYYLLKDIENNEVVLSKMHDACLKTPSNGKSYYLWVLNNLTRLKFDKEQNLEALNYAIEKTDYINNLSNVSEAQRINALNDLIVAQLKSNHLDGIDLRLQEIETFYRAQYGEKSREYAFYLHNRGRAYQLQNKLEEAKAIFLKSINLQNNIDGRPSEKTVKYFNEVEQQLGEL